MSQNETPLSDFMDDVHDATKDQPQIDPNAPKVPFQSALRLTGEQETKMIEWAFTRYEYLQQECGRDKTINPTWWMNMSPSPSLLLASQGLLPANTFLGKRSRFDATFYNDVTWRPWTIGPENIFMSSNITVPVVRRICRQMIARARNSFFASDPWFSITPMPEPSTVIDDELAQKIENFCRFKLDEADSKTDKERAIQRALILGECPVKTTYVMRDQMFDCEAMVLTDVTGEAIPAADGEQITQDDEWEDQPLLQQQQQPGIMGKVGAMISQGRFSPTVKVLKRDGVTQMPDAPIWTKQLLSRRQVLFEGARSEPIYYKDFLCPLTAESVQTADCVVHLYDKPVSEFVDLAVKRGMVDNSNLARSEATQKFAACVQQLQANTGMPKAAMTLELRPNENFSPIPAPDNSGPVSEFAEFYLWYDANGDGIAENIMLICDRNSRQPIFYDHVANITTDGLRPIEMVRINPIEGRWYGMGIMELFESYQVVIDLMVNRWNFSQSRAGRVDFWDPAATLEGDREPNLKMNYGKTYSLKPGKKAEDACKSIYLTDVKFDQVERMINYFTQLLMNESGVTNSNDGKSAGLDSQKTATGIINVQQSGDELFNPIIADLKGPLSKILTREIDVTLANMDAEEAFTYLEGDTMGVDKLTPDDVRGLKFKVKIELTSHKNQQALQTSAQAAALVEKFYMLAPEIQAKVAPFYRDQIHALDPHCAVDQVIVPMMPMPVAAPGMPQEAQGGGGAVQPQTGSTEQLGDAGADGSTPFSTQLTQSQNPKTGS